MPPRLLKQVIQILEGLKLLYQNCLPIKKYKKGSPRYQYLIKVHWNLSSEEFVFFVGDSSLNLHLKH